MKTHLAIVVLVVGLVVGIVGGYYIAPAAVPADGEITYTTKDIIFMHSFMDRDEPNFLLWNDSARDYAEQKQGADVMFFDLVFEGDLERMINQLEQMALQYDPKRMVLLSWPGDEGGFRSTGEWCEQNEVYWGSWYCEPPDYDFAGHHYQVSASHDESFRSGYTTTMRMIEDLMDVKGMDPSDMNFIWVGAGIYGWCWPLRVAGFAAACEEMGCNILGGNFTGWTRETAYELTTTLITRHGAGNIHGGFSVFNGPGLGILEAFRDAGIKAPVVTIDLIEEVALEILNGDPEEAYMCCAINNNSRWAAMQNMSRAWKARMGLWYPETEADKHWAFTGDIIDRSNIRDWYMMEYEYPKSDYEVDEYMWGQLSYYNTIMAIPGYLPEPTAEQMRLLEEYTEEF